MTMRIKKKLILHIGFSKCGSTSLQHILSTNEQYFLSNKVRVLRIEDIFSPEVHELGISKNLLDVKFRPEILGDDNHYYILSDEGLGGSEAVGFRDAELKAQLFLKVASLVSIEIICCVKPIPSWISSMWSQKLVEGSSNTINFCLPPGILDTYSRYIKHLMDNAKFCPSEAIISWERIHDTKIRLFTVSDFFNDHTGIRWILNQVGKPELFDGLVIRASHQNRALSDQIGLDLYTTNKHATLIFGVASAARTIDLLRALFGKIFGSSRVERLTLPFEGFEKFISKERDFFSSRGVELLPLGYQVRAEKSIKQRIHIVLVLILLFPFLNLIAAAKNRLVSR